jgi:aminoglycoside phosphotransferase (APT) family kinase protein
MAATENNTEIAPAAIRAVLERQFPELAPVSAIYLGCGMDSVAHVINERWVFRFPMRTSVDRQLQVERALLPVLAPRLPVAIPAFRYWGRPSDDYPMHFAGYEKLPGPTGVEIDQKLVAFDALAPQLGAFLTALHAFPIADAERLGVEVSRVEEQWEGIRTDALECLTDAASVAPRASIERVRGYLERLEPLAAPPWPVSLVHQDLSAEHVLLDATGTGLTGVIDWGDVAIADPTIDFVGWYAWGGERFVRAVLEHYRGPVDARVLDRVAPWATFKVVQDIRFGLDHDQPDVVRVALAALTSFQLTEPARTDRVR